VRISAGAPFDHPDDRWTLLTYSMPESRRDLRHKVRSVLTWAGFGSVRDGLWIAPGALDVPAVFADAGLTEVIELAAWFAASPLAGVDMEALVHRAWPIEEIRQRHATFLATWADAPQDRDALAQIVLLGADWLQVLRADPGLPTRLLAADWPSAQSTAVFRRTYSALLQPARSVLQLALDAHRPR
jgi:DNA-binding transcriptional regulator PaaX